MAAFAWVMMGIALWHFSVFVPDRFWGGIVGGFIAAIVGAIIFGLLINGFHVAGRDDTHIIQAIEAVPGTIIGLAICYWIGVRKEEKEASSKRS